MTTDDIKVYVKPDCLIDMEKAEVIADGFRAVRMAWVWKDCLSPTDNHYAGTFPNWEVDASGPFRKTREEAEADMEILLTNAT